jgi:hypothetical protein
MNGFPISDLVIGIIFVYLSAVQLNLWFSIVLAGCAQKKNQMMLSEKC